MLTPPKRLATLLAACLSLAAGRANELYKVDRVAGSTYAWLPGSTSWQPLSRGDAIPVDSLLQVTPGASIRLDAPNLASATGQGGSHMRLDIGAPTIIRLDASLFRKVQVDSFYLAKQPDKLVAKEFGAESLLYDLGEAWHRYAALLYQEVTSAATQTQAAADGHGTPTEEAPKVGVRIKKIDLYTPADGTVIVADRYPARTTIAWKDVSDPQAVYRVYVWPRAEKRGIPTVATTLRRQEVSFDRPGSYFVQVETVDGDWQSRPSRVDVVPSRAVGARDADDPTTPVIASTRLKLTEPPRGLQIAGATRPTEMRFAWSLSHLSGNENVLYDLVVTDRVGKTLVRRRTTATSAVVTLPPRGSLLWFVEARVASPQAAANSGDALLKPHYISAVRQLRIGAATVDLRQLLRDNKPATVYLETGL